MNFSFKRSGRSIKIFQKGVLIVKKGLSSLVELIFPSRCFFCRILLDNDSFSCQDHKILSTLCPDCLHQFIPDNLSCPRCGGTRHQITPTDLFCPSCKRWRTSFQRVIAFGDYHSNIEPFILQMKKDQSGRCAEQWIQFLIYLREEELLALNSDLILSVPMFITRRIFLGINPPEEMARSLSKFLHIPYSTSTIVRIKATHRQRFLSPKLRKKNVENAFLIKKRGFFPFWNRPVDVRGKKIILVDDILTTGATCEEITKLLLSAGAEKIDIVVIARGQGNTHKFLSTDI